MNRILADALLPPEVRRAPTVKKPFARPGEVVTCENGHVIGTVAVVFPRADDEARPMPGPEDCLRDFGPFQSKEAFLAAVERGLRGPAHRDVCCEICGRPYAKFMYTRAGDPKGTKWHFQGEGWRPKRRRRRR